MNSNFNQMQNFNAAHQEPFGQLNIAPLSGRQLLFGPRIFDQQPQPNFSKDQAAQFEQPAPAWHPRVQGKKFAFLKRKPAMQWNFKKHHAVHSKIPLQQLRGKRDAIGDLPLLEKKHGIAWTIVIEELFTAHRRAPIGQQQNIQPIQQFDRPIGQQQQQRSIDGQPNFHGAQAAQFEQPAKDWKPRVSKKHSYLKRKPAQKWHFKKHHTAHSKIPLDKLRGKRDAIGNLPLLEKKHGIAWTVEIQELLVVDRRPLKESTGHKLKRKAKEFAHAVVHPKETYKSVGHDERVVPLELQPAAASLPFGQAGPVVEKRLIDEQRDVRREHFSG